MIKEIILGDSSLHIAMGPFGSSIKRSTFVDYGIPIISGEHLHGTKLEEKTGFNYISEEHANRHKNSIIHRGDVVFTAYGTLGQVSYVPKNSKFEKYIASQRQFFLRPNLEILDPRFLTYFFHTSKGKHLLLSNSSQVGVPSIASPTSFLRSLKISVPDLPIQKAIANILGTLDEKIELNRKTNETLEDIAKALFKSWFIDFDPVRAKADSRSTGLPDEISDLFPDSFEDSELGKIPSGWKISNLGESSFYIESGKRPKGGVQKDLKHGIPSIGAESIDFAGSFDFSKAKYVSEDFANFAKKGWVENFDVALYKDGCGKGGEPGQFNPRVAIYGDDFPFKKFMINEHVFLIRSNELGQPFLYNLFDSRIVRNQIIQMGSSKGAQPGLNQKEVASCIYIKPHQSPVNLFNILSTPFLKKQFSLGKRNVFLTKLRDTLLPKLISGELRIPDAEKMIEEVEI